MLLIRYLAYIYADEIFDTIQQVKENESYLKITQKPNVDYRFNDKYHPTESNDGQGKI